MALHFDNARIPYENVLGEQAVRETESRKGFQGAMKTFDASRPAVAASAIGIGMRAHNTPGATSTSEPSAAGASAGNASAEVERKRRAAVMGLTFGMLIGASFRFNPLQPANARAMLAAVSGT